MSEIEDIITTASNSHQSFNSMTREELEAKVELLQKQVGKLRAKNNKLITVGCERQKSLGPLQTKPLWEQPLLHIEHVSMFFKKIPKQHKNKLWERHCDIPAPPKGDDSDDSDYTDSNDDDDNSSESDLNNENNSKNKKNKNGKNEASDDENDKNDDKKLSDTETKLLKSEEKRKRKEEKQKRKEAKIERQECKRHKNEALSTKSIQGLLFSIVALCIKIHDRNIRTPARKLLLPRLLPYYKNIRWNIKNRRENSSQLKYEDYMENLHEWLVNGPCMYDPDWYDSDEDITEDDEYIYEIKSKDTPQRNPKNSFLKLIDKVDACLDMIDQTK